MSERPQALHSTVPSHCIDCIIDEHCPGCIFLTYIPDENAYVMRCNECLAELGWAREDWSNPDDRYRLGSTPIPGTQ